MRPSKSANGGGRRRPPHRLRPSGLEALEDRRLLSTLDASFGVGGRTLATITTPGATNATYGAVAVQPDGKYVVVGTATNVAGNRDFAIARLNADGTPDMTFNRGAGVKLVGFDLGGGLSGNNDDIATDVAIQPDGKIVVAGTASGSYITLTRLLPNGDFDLSFESDGKLNTNGIRTTNVDNPVLATVSVAVQNSDADGGIYKGRIVVAAGNFVMQFSGSDGQQVGFARITFTGNTFDPGTPFGPGLSADTIINDLAIQPDGKIVVVGYGLITPAANDTFQPNTPAFSAMGVSRLLPNGGNDFSFGTEVDYQPYNVSPTLPNPTASPPTADTNLGDNPTLVPSHSFTLINSSNVTSSVANGVTIGPDGSIYVVGTESLGDRTQGSEGRMLLVKLTNGLTFRGSGPNDGSDPSRYGNHPFWGSGANFNNSLREGLARADGVVDGTFTAGGVFPVEGIAKGLEIAFDPHADQLVAIGYVNVSGPTGQQFAIIRTDPDGNVDFNFANSFGVDVDRRFQSVAVQTDSTSDLAQNVILLADGRIVVAGSSAVGSASSIGLVRLLTDEPPAISIDDVTVTEGDSGTTNAVLTVSLAGTYTLPTSVNVAITGGTAAAGTDYAPLASPLVVTFAPGETTKQVTIPIVGDLIQEATKTITVGLSNPIFGTLGKSSGTVTILDTDPPPPTISIDDVTVAEGSGGTSSAVFTVSLSYAFSVPITVTVNTAEGTALAGSDFTALASPLVLTFLPGETAKQVAIPLVTDLRDEPDELFTVHLSDPVVGTLAAKSVGTATIVDDDPPPPAISVDDVTVAEGNSGENFAIFTVSLAYAYALPVTVRIATADGSAISGVDYSALPSPSGLTFAPGQTQLQVWVPVLTNTTDQTDRTFTFNLFNPSLGTLAKAKGTATIVDDDPPPPPPPPPPASMDTTPPVLLDVTPVAAAGRRARGRLASVRLQFNEALDPANASNMGNYAIVVRQGFGRRARMRPINLRAAQYDPTSNSVTLVAANPRQLRRGVVVNVGSGITDRAGNPLDGNADGIPGPSVSVQI